MKPVLSIIILNYNSKKFTLEAVSSLESNYLKELHSGEYEIIVADNASKDNSLEAFAQYKKHTKIKSFIICDNKLNLGFSRGNNEAIKFSKGDYVLILNPDTLVPPKTLTFLLDFMGHHPDAGAVTCKIVLPDGSLDENCVRGFPTPWNSFCHFSGLNKTFPAIPLFAGYLQSGWRDLNKIQEIDAIEGAFMLIPGKLGEKLKWFDEDYFFYGEDLQLCLDIRNAGYKIYYVPDVFITHHGGATSGIKKQSEKVTTADTATKRKVQGYRFNSMRIFYQKNYAGKYPKFVSWLINLTINLLYNKHLSKIEKTKNT